MRTRARRAVIAALLSSSVIAAAPALAQAPPSAATAPSVGFKSGGINAVITSVSPTQRGLVVQMLIQNTRAAGIYISPITSAGMGAAAMSSKGNLYTIGENGFAVTGMGPCDLDGGNYNNSVSQCLKAFTLENMTYLDPGQSTVLALTYDRRSTTEETSDTVSFTLKFLVRSAPAQADTLATAGKSDAVGPPGIVTLSFPLVPLKGPG